MKPVQVFARINKRPDMCSDMASLPGQQPGECGKKGVRGKGQESPPLKCRSFCMFLNSLLLAYTQQNLVALLCSCKWTFFPPFKDLPKSPGSDRIRTSLGSDF